MHEQTINTVIFEEWKVCEPIFPVGIERIIENLIVYELTNVYLWSNEAIFLLFFHGLRLMVNNID